MRVIRTDKYIEPLVKQTQGVRFIVFDTETYIDKISNDTIDFRFRLGCMIKLKIDKTGVIKKRDIVRFNSVEEFYDELDNFLPKRSKVYVFAHNVGFDIRALRLMDYLLKQGWQCEPPIINNRVFMWTLRLDGRTIAFLDTANFGVLSVSDLGKQLGHEKSSVSFDNVSDDELYTYCQRDTEIIEKFIVEYYMFILNNGLGAFKNTLASQSMCAFRTCFMSNPPMTHTKELALKLERSAYHGGRVECLFIGNPMQPGYYKVDVNSMYPYCMKNFDYPNELLYTFSFISLDRLKEYMKTHYCIAEVYIKTSKPVYPYINNGKLVFPVGRFVTTLHHIELERALKDGSIIRVNKVCVYNKTRFFNSYIDFFYTSKINAEKSGNKAWRLISKLFMNSLYGKFGETQKVRTVVSHCDYDLFFREPCINGDTGEKYSLIYWLGDIYKDYALGESLLSCPSIAGAVTAYARYMLFNYMEIAGESNCFYMDTDSLIVNSEGYHNLSNYIDKFALGKLKLEGVANRVIIWGNKDYQFGKKLRVKGISANSRKINKTTWESLQFSSFLNWLTNGAKGYPIGKTILKSRKHKYNKGRLSKSGKVYPLVIDFPFSVFLLLIVRKLREFYHLFSAYWHRFLRVFE